MTFVRSSRSRRAKDAAASAQHSLLGGDPGPLIGDATPGSAGLFGAIEGRTPSDTGSTLVPGLSVTSVGRPGSGTGSPFGLPPVSPGMPGDLLGSLPAEETATSSGLPLPSVPPASARSTRRRVRFRVTIGVKLGVLLAAILAVLVVASGVLIAETRATAGGFDSILQREVRQGLLARQMQVEFTQRVQEWKNLLLRGANPRDRAEFVERLEEQDRITDSLCAQLLISDPDPEVKRQLKLFEEAERVADVAYEQALDKFLASSGRDYAEADRAVRGVDRPGVDRIDNIVAELEKRIAERVRTQERLAEERQRITMTAAAALLFLLAGFMVFALHRIVRPIRHLIRQAERAATDHLPNALAKIKAMDAEDEPPVLPPLVVRTRDELHDLGEALTTLQDSALGQAIEQHRADRETSEMLVNLGRRNQNLLGRMLSYVTELERKEQDPEVLSQLFRLDHATTRIRRNAESMLVLAGAHQTRTWSRPVSVIDVVRAALSEIEEYIRVDLHHIEDALVNGSAVADVVHLIAELVENATHFSPPTTQVTVIGQRVREGYRLRVIDQGVGMTQRELEDANQRIRRSDGVRTNAKLLGLHVVGRLARRRSIEATLEPSAGRGITASILLPESVLGLAQSSSDGSPHAVPPHPGLPHPGLPHPGPSAQAVPPLRSASAPSAAPRPPVGPGDFPPGGPVSVETPTRPTPVPSAQVPSAPMPMPVPSGPAPTLPSSVTTAFGGSRRTMGGDGPEDSSRVIDLTESSAPVIPRRVRGAQLPDLGPADDPVLARPDDSPGAAESLRWQLRSFQLDVQAARRAISESGPDDRSDPMNGQYPEGE
ncbi:MAG: hypothetical protein QG622_3524 [Actinomycetota bacterium]|nr:hypothetical protein [Actinomycetota bacterium]